ncbi:MAG: hypothetical protein KJZ75_11270 [Hyphomonadaceae bacterium]|nr:hypothetical protein [Hyphomonadaceae bacterium]
MADTPTSPASNATVVAPIGDSGLKAYGGFIQEEFLPELSGERGKRKFREMAANDPTVRAVLFGLTALVGSVEWPLKAADDTPAAEDAKKFAEDVFDKMQTPLGDVITEACTMFTYGFAPCEITFEPREDGKYGIREIALRAQNTIQRWEIDRNSGAILGLHQQTTWKSTVFIPINKLALFRTTSIKNNPEGESILRGLYRPWYFKSKIEEIEAVGIERDLAGLPVVRVPLSLFKNAADGDQTARAALDGWKRLATQVRRDQNEGVVIPSDVYEDESGKPSGNAQMYEFKLLSSGGGRSFDTTAIIDRYDRKIATAVLMDFIFLGQASVGSFALAQPHSAKVLTPSGWTTMGEIKPGDEVVCPLGRASKVLDTYDHGVKQAYRVTLADGREIFADADHKWVVTTPFWKRQGVPRRARLPWAATPPEPYPLLDRYGVLTTKQIMERMASGMKDSRFHVPVTQPVDYAPAAPLPVDPYILGVLLGDGSMPKRRAGGEGGPTFLSADAEIIDAVTARLPENHRLTPRRCDSNARAFRISGPANTGGGCNHFINGLDALGLIGTTSHSKFIPAPYLRASIPDRLALLRGLMDTDGYCSTIGQVRFSTVSDALRDGVVELVRSLGGLASVSFRDSKGYRHPKTKEWVEKHTRSWLVTITMPDGMNPFLLTRKAERVRRRSATKPMGPGIAKIEPVSEEPMRCIRVSSPSAMYVTDGFTPTHNSSDKTALFAQALGSYVKRMADVLNRQVLKRLWELNSLDEKLMPKFEPGDLEKPDLGELSAFVSTMAGAGAQLFVSQDDQNWARKLAGMPPAPEEGLGDQGAPGAAEDDDDQAQRIKKALEGFDAGADDDWILGSEAA